MEPGCSSRPTAVQRGRKSPGRFRRPIPNSHPLLTQLSCGSRSIRALRQHSMRRPMLGSPAELPEAAVWRRSATGVCGSRQMVRSPGATSTRSTMQSIGPLLMCCSIREIRAVFMPPFSMSGSSSLKPERSCHMEEARGRTAQSRQLGRSRVSQDFSCCRSADGAINGDDPLCGVRRRQR